VFGLEQGRRGKKRKGEEERNKKRKGEKKEVLGENDIEKEEKRMKKT
jgi:hypothetical protein